jgi:hypothetical protein
MKRVFSVLGIIPRALSQIFDDLRSNLDTEFSVRVSFVAYPVSRSVGLEWASQIRNYFHEFGSESFRQLPVPVAKKLRKTSNLTVLWLPNNCFLKTDLNVPLVSNKQQNTYILLAS